MAGATKDAQRYGVQVWPVDVMHSDVDASLEELPEFPAMRLGLRMVRGLQSQSAERIVQERSRAPFDSAQDLARRCHLELHEMKLLAAAGALQSLAGHRRQKVWETAALHAVNLRDERTVLAQLPAAFEHFNEVHPHSSLKMRSPREFRRHQAAQVRQEPSTDQALYCE